MGLFCFISHVYESEQTDVQVALVEALKKNNYDLLAISKRANSNIEKLLKNVEAPAYLIGKQEGKWVTIIDIFGEPFIADIASLLSEECKNYVLSFTLLDDDVLLYNLDKNGEALDGYNSNLQFFQEEKFSESYIEEQRHSPEEFQNLIPGGKTLKDFIAILNDGWWNAHDEGRLNSDGVMTEDDIDKTNYAFEGDRMTAIGKFLELAGNNENYPYSNWQENKDIILDDFYLIEFHKSKKNGFLKKLFNK